MNTELLTIENCPKCEGKHRYKLSVGRSVIIKMMTMADFSEPKRRVKITRLFACPASGDTFQATFILTETSSDRIKSVSVAGVADESIEE